MNKLDLIKTLKTEAGLTKKEASAVVHLFFDEIANALAGGDRVRIRGLCSFFVKQYKAYTGRNPKTGEQIKIKPKKLPVFKCGKELKDRLSPPRQQTLLATDDLCDIKPATKKKRSMLDNLSTDMPWVIFLLQDQPFAVSSNYVREMLAMPNIVSVPQMPLYIRGVINLRGQVVPVIDLRIRLGMTSLLGEAENLINLLHQCEQDHKNWLAELESSVKEHREFKLALDPHKCAFGEWYDNFTTDNRILANCLNKFDAPHKRIHAVAIEVKKLESEESSESALAVIERTRNNELAEMIKLFSEARNLLRESVREIAMVLEWNEKKMAVAVDSIETVEKMSPSNIEEMPETIFSLDSKCVVGVVKRDQDDKLVQILDVNRLIGRENEMVVEIKT